KTPRNWPCPGVVRRLCAVQARPLRAHGIDAGGVVFSSSHRTSPPVEFSRKSTSGTKRHHRPPRPVLPTRVTSALQLPLPQRLPRDSRHNQQGVASPLL